jgi:spore maturation protein SpmB
MKPFSGAGSRGLMLDTFATHGVDSFIGKLSATFQGSTDTTFYVVAVYFGAVGVKKNTICHCCGINCRFSGNYCGHTSFVFVF